MMLSYTIYGITFKNVAVNTLALDRRLAINIASDDSLLTPT